MNIAVYSGSFDPIHTGHAMLASYCAQYCDGVDQVWLMVSPQNPLKPGTTTAGERQRLDMARMVAEGCNGVYASDFETGLPRPSYTYHTLCALRRQMPQHHFRLMIGSDNWLMFQKWKDWENILSEFGLLIYPRPGYPVDTDSLPDNATYLADAPQIELSSTFIREGLRQRLSMNYFLPSSVYKYILDNNLYGTH